MRRINYDPILMGERILQKRKECNYSQELVAEKLNVSPNSISRYENGTRDIPIDILVEMSNLYGVSMDYLVTGECPTDGSEMNSDLLEMIMKYTPRQRAVVVNVLKNVNEAFHVGV